MGIILNPPIAVLLAAGLLALAFYVFARVRSDYQARGMLSRPVAVLQTGFFCVYALSSYLFLDSRLTAVAATGWLLALSILLMVAGFAVVLAAMPFLGKRSFGMEAGQLHTSGIYRHSRNPQLVGGFLFIVGYVLLWPSRVGALWAALWIPIAHLMAKAEEEHLTKVFGREYEEYCSRTPRYFGVRKKR